MNEVVPVNKEYFFDETAIVSQTDLKGVITYANRSFSKISGYSISELVGKPHNIVRHPDMPKVVFEKMWNTLKAGQVWNGLVKNLRKDGKYYWVNSEILPIRDNNNSITGYIAARKAASREDIQENQETYKKMLQTQD